MKITIFGLTITSSWGNGHATLWRGLLRNLAARGHRVTFFERDVPYYARHRDLTSLEGVNIRLYSSWGSVYETAQDELRNSDAGLVSSFCPDSVPATELVLSSPAAVKIFYDLDTPFTLKNLNGNPPVFYIHKDGLSGFDIILSYTGGTALEELKTRLGAKIAIPLYGWVDPVTHYPAPLSDNFKCSLSYLGTYSEDRQDKLQELFIEPAKLEKNKLFVLGGSMYPEDIRWPSNIRRYDHILPSEHPLFFSSSLFTLNITRGPMAAMGYCPSGRLFEASACGTPIISDYWKGLELFFTPGEDILIARKREDVIRFLNLDEREIMDISQRARENVLKHHTAEKRAEEFEDIVYSTLLKKLKNA